VIDLRPCAARGAGAAGRRPAGCGRPHRCGCCERAWGGQRRCKAAEHSVRKVWSPKKADFTQINPTIACTEYDWTKQLQGPAGAGARCRQAPSHPSPARGAGRRRPRRARHPLPAETRRRNRKTCRGQTVVRDEHKVSRCNPRDHDHGRPWGARGAAPSGRRTPPPARKLVPATAERARERRRGA